MIKVIVIDDEPLARSIVCGYLSAFSDMEIVAQCGDGFEGVKAIAKHKPDLIFLDIQMPRISGFEMLEILDEAPGVIFTTAFDEFAIKAFEESAIDYLLKPFSRERFDKAISKWQLQKGNKSIDSGISLLAGRTDKSSGDNQRIVVKTGNEIKIIPIHEVHYLEAYDDYVKVHTAEGYYLKKKTMAACEKMLDGLKFVRTHRSFILNLQQLTKLEPFEKEGYMAVLKSGTRIPVSRSGYSRLREVFDL